LLAQADDVWLLPNLALVAGGPVSAAFAALHLAGSRYSLSRRMRKPWSPASISPNSSNWR
jgi:hypothetical protein